MAVPFTLHLAPAFGRDYTGQAANVRSVLTDGAGGAIATVSSFTEATDGTNGEGGYHGTQSLADLSTLALPVVANHYIVGQVGIGYTEILLQDFAALRTLMNAAGLLGSFGVGFTAVNHNTGGADNLRLTIAGVGVDGADVRAYLASDWTAGNYGQSFIKGQATTGPVSGVSGRMPLPMYLQSGNTYTIVFDKIGEVQSFTVNVTI